MRNANSGVEEWIKMKEIIEKKRNIKIWRETIKSGNA